MNKSWVISAVGVVMLFLIGIYSQIGAAVAGQQLSAQAVVPSGQISGASISWGTDPDRVIFNWTATDLDAAYEYWVYPYVGFTENGGPFGSTPEDEASNLADMYDMVTANYRTASNGNGEWSWGGGKPTNPTGSLALLAYDPVTQQSWVVATSAEIDTSAWNPVPSGQISGASISWGTDPDRVIFNWTATDLDAAYEYWVYPYVGFTENGGPFGSTPEDEASNLADMYDMVTANYRTASNGNGEWSWGGGKPTNPTGSLALLAYDPVTQQSWVVATSAEIDTSAWNPVNSLKSPDIFVFPSPVMMENVPISGIAKPETLIRIYVNGQIRDEITSGSYGGYTFNVNLLEGENSIYTTLVDNGVEGPPSKTTKVVRLAAKLPQDFNNDGIIDLFDLVEIARLYGQTYK